jgi:hypothetical protein
MDPSSSSSYAVAMNDSFKVNDFLKCHRPKDLTVRAIHTKLASVQVYHGWDVGKETFSAVTSDITLLGVADWEEQLVKKQGITFSSDSGLHSL